LSLSDAPLLTGEKMVKSLMDITCAILAGGESRRMGRDKATLAVGSRPLIRLVYETACLVFSRVIIISSRHARFEGIEAPVLPDVVSGTGSMVGIVSALTHSTTPYVFVLGCDMPNLSAQALSYMVSEAHGEDIIIPRMALGYEALHAIYNKSCIGPFLAAIEAGNLKIPSVFPSLLVKEVGDHPAFTHRGRSVFINVNKESDLPVAFDYEFREMSGSDLDGVLLIERRSFTLPWTRRLFEEALLSPITGNFVILDGKELIGYLCLYTVLNEAHILNVAIHPDHRKAGRGSALIERVVDLLTERGIVHFYLEVREGNTDAIKLYNKFGFVAIGIRKKYYTDTNEDALVMHLLAGNE
jgi:ribosomal-protein-alanine acetyltransferase